MALTELQLTIDQTRPGWGARALAEATVLLQSAGRPALAEALRRAAPAPEDAVGALAELLRLKLTCGRAAAVVPPPASGRGGPGRAGAFAGELPRRLREAWRAPWSPGTLCSPLACGTILMGTDTDGTLVAREIATGKEIWRAEACRFNSATAYAAGRVLAWVRGGGLCCLDLFSGAELWRRTDVGLAAPNATATEEVVVLGLADGSLAALDIESGEELWRRPKACSARGAPVVSDGRILSASVDSGSGVHCHDLQSGRMLWHQTVNGRAVDGLAARDGRVMVPARLGRLHVLGLEDGCGLWSEATGELGTGSRAPAVGADAVAWSSGTGALSAMALGDPRVLWSRPNGTFRSDAAPTLCGETLLVVGRSALLQALDLASGEDLWHFGEPQPRRNAACPPVVSACGRILLAFAPGGLIALEDGPGADDQSTTPQGGRGRRPEKELQSCPRVPKGKTPGTIRATAACAWWCSSAA